MSENVKPPGCGVLDVVAFVVEFTGIYKFLNCIFLFTFLPQAFLIDTHTEQDIIIILSQYDVIW